jgi:hypothetical protein
MNDEMSNFASTWPVMPLCESILSRRDVCGDACLVLVD